MQLSLPLTAPDTPPAERVVFVRHRRARRYLLRVLPDGAIRVTLPRWGRQHEAQDFIDANRDWIARQRARRLTAPARAGWTDGSRMLLDGLPVTLTVECGPSGHRVYCGGQLVAEACRDAANVRPVVEQWLRQRARRELPAELHALADRHAIAVTRVSVRDQRSRWGACSASGTITLNWRLVQTPAFVREYVLLHELMHRRELNHSRRFWRLVERCCPRYLEARRWLLKEGKALWSDCE